MKQRKDPQFFRDSMSTILFLLQGFVVIEGFQVADRPAFCCHRLLRRRRRPCCSPSYPMQVRTSIAQYAVLRQNIQVPLFDAGWDKSNENNDSTNESETWMIPLPSSHLPSELATPFVYGMQVERPVHKRLIQEACRQQGASSDQDDDNEKVYGHIVWKVPHSDSLVGAIGCTAEILLLQEPTSLSTLGGFPLSEMDPIITSTVSPPFASSSPSSDTDDSPPLTVLCRGGYRFVVKQVVKTIPYPVAIIDEIQDDDCMEDNDLIAQALKGRGDNGNDDDDDDDDDIDQYSSLSTTELIQRTMRATQTLVTQRLEEAIQKKKQMSPLEQSILEGTGMPVNPAAVEQSHAEEMSAVWDVFQASLVDDDVPPADRPFAIAMMAAELANVPNRIRRHILVLRDRVQRLRVLLKHLEELVGMAQARKLATQITDTINDASKDLKVGQPQLPPWAKGISKGTRIEYFWSEQDGWFPGEVIENPIMVVDELLLTVRFDDGEVHRLPLTADEKVRWRPGRK